MFDPHCLLLLRIVTHRDVLQSLAVEKAVGTIYNVIYGLNGSRAVLFFQNLVSYMNDDRGDQKDSPDQLGSLDLVAKALLQLLTVNQGAVIRAEFKAIAQSLCNHVADQGTPSGPTSMLLPQLFERLHSISDILALGDAFEALNLDTKTSASTSHQQASAEYEHYPDFPGNLSELGPRHDNDHELISNIRILPTLAEINSARDEFLPTRDGYSQPGAHHQRGILRLLDSQFRLLREDTSGLLRDAVRMVVEHWNTIIDSANWAAKRTLIRRESPTPLRIYHGAEVRQIFAGPIQGLQIEVEFDQPPRVRKIGPERRRRHWINSRGLREGGGLVALIDGAVEDAVHVTFLQVSKRKIDPSQRGQPGLVCDLVNNDERAVVTLRFPGTPNQGDLSSLLAMQSARQQYSERPLLLVEFPAILYNQFEGILRCLQTMHQNPSDIPFTRWLTAGTRSSNIDHSFRDTAIPPPRYLGGATFEISSILNSGNGSNMRKQIIPLTISAQDDPHSLSQRLCQLSSLDAGQAEAMVSALTHEVALIQGPPGTGKSYVGIQIAKCLISNQERMGLGPLLCV